jgi:hypothetical protein
MRAVFAFCIICGLLWGFLYSPAQAQWEYGGIEIVPNSWQTWDFNIGKDINGGILFAWEDNREINNPDVYIQKVDTAGVVLWQEYGVNGAISEAGQYYPFVVSDGQGGAYMAWSDIGRNGGGNYDIYAQHFNSLGARTWDDSGLNVVLRGGHQFLDHMISDGQGGAILCWPDEYWAYTDTLPVVVQRIDSSGNLLFGTDGIRMTPLQEGRQYCSRLTMTSDSAFVVIWMDSRLFGQGPGLYAQKLDLNGNILWDSVGVPVAVETVDTDCGDFSISPGPAGGLYAVWRNHLGPQIGISMQWVNELGQAMWGASGLVISGSFWDGIPKILANDDGEAVICWTQADPYKGLLNIIDTTGTLFWPNHFQIGFHINFIYGIAQSNPGEFEIGLEKSDLDCIHRIFKFDFYGNYIWGDTGVCLTCPSCPSVKQKVISDDIGGAYLSWKRSVDVGVRLNRVYPDGWVAPDTTTGIYDDLVLPNRRTIDISVYPNPFNYSTLITYRLFKQSDITIEVYDILGRNIISEILVNQPIGFHKYYLKMKDFPSGIYFARINTNAGFSDNIKMMLIK